jgi:8-oxo-dGTP diphosphatase
MDPVIVSAAVIERDGAFLLTRRLEGTHLEGTWEFPGGKCEPEETPEACLVGRRVLVTRHDYPERSVELHFFDATLVGEPMPLIGQQMRWVRRGELGTLELPEADAALIGLLTRA